MGVSVDEASGGAGVPNELACCGVAVPEELTSDGKPTVGMTCRRVDEGVVGGCEADAAAEGVEPDPLLPSPDWSGMPLLKPLLGLIVRPGVRVVAEGGAASVSVVVVCSFSVDIN